MENEFDKIDTKTGGEAFLDLAARQAMHNFIYGDKKSLNAAMELEHERVGFKKVLEADSQQNKKEKKSGRSKR